MDLENDRKTIVLKNKCNMHLKLTIENIFSIGFVDMICSV